MVRTSFVKKASTLLCFALKGLFLAIAVVMSVTLEAYASQVIGARLSGDAQVKSKLVIELTEPVAYDVFSLDNPKRLVIDLKDAALVYNLKRLPLADTPVSSIRWARRNDHDLRIVLDLNYDMNVSSFTLRPDKGVNHRLVIDLNAQDAGIFSEDDGRVKNLRAVPQSMSPKEELKSLVNQDTLNTLATQEASLSDYEPDKTLSSLADFKLAGRDIIIAIDAGHGGKDPGAIGHNGAKEKNITLAIAREVATLFALKKGFQAKLIRDNDNYIPLRGRLKKARESDADLFLSIHADAFHRKSANGASIYTLSARGATSETARWLANRENNVDLIGGGDGISLGDKDNLLASVLLDLSMTDTQARSIGASKRVLSELGKVNNLHKNHVEKAAFVVLKSPDIPSMLVETGFISNPTEARKLNRSSHQKKIAKAIYKGVQDFFIDQPPLGTWIAMQKERQPNMHTVLAGETLSDIALRYNISMRRLLATNNLTSADYIQVGQSLKLP